MDWFGRFARCVELSEFHRWCSWCNCMAAACSLDRACRAAPPNHYKTSTARMCLEHSSCNNPRCQSHHYQRHHIVNAVKMRRHPRLDLWQTVFSRSISALPAVRSTDAGADNREQESCHDGHCSCPTTVINLESATRATRLDLMSPALGATEDSRASQPEAFKTLCRLTATGGWAEGSGTRLAPAALGWTARPLSATPWGGRRPPVW